QVAPRYDQITLDPAAGINTLTQIVSPNADDEGVWIHQNAWFHLGTFNKEVSATYSQHTNETGTYFFVLEGSFEINGEKLDRRDGMGVTESSEHQIKALSEGSRILIMEVEMI
ncbi:MAG: pirin family protein, partial [Saprospiraceae bacterium]|nr:pirin family protein [Saprospiraceae bacterium]